MLCELCGNADKASFSLLPIKGEGGKLNTLACGECTEKSTAYCRIHSAIHQGFSDGSTACLICVNEAVESYRELAPALVQGIRASLAPDQRQELFERAHTSSLITGDEENVSIIRFVASKAKRSSQTLEAVVAEIAESRSAACILL
jgi:hypothetical protein